MITDKTKFLMGLGLLLSFSIVLVIMFSPVINGKNVLEYLDTLYNSISKGSAYYVPEVKEAVEKLPEEMLETTMSFQSAEQAERAGQLFRESGVETAVQGTQVSIDGKLGAILTSCLEDAVFMYNNNGEAVSSRYGYDGRHVLYNWWKSLKALEKKLSQTERFQEAKLVAHVQEKVVEPAYNYYGVEPRKITDQIGIVVISLLFYVIYTIWYGYAIMFLFEGWGFSLSH